MSVKFDVSFGSSEEEIKLYELVEVGKSKYVKKCIKFHEDYIGFIEVWKKLCNDIDSSLKEEYIKKAIEFYIKYNHFEEALEQILIKTRENQ